MNEQLTVFGDNPEYEAFVEKFKPKKTTDDCYTPPVVYDAIKGWAAKEYGWENREIVRPFYPGGDYENFTYPENCVVIDNPPFSILSKIVKFYAEREIDYFLFAPTLTLFSPRAAKSRIGVGAQIEYENGAIVNTSFLCSSGPAARSAPDLYKVIQEAALKNKQPTAKIPKYEYPASVLTSSRLAAWSKYGIEYQEEHLQVISALDMQKQFKKTIFGSGALVPEAAAREAAAREAAAREAAAREAAAREENLKVWLLSDREKEVVANLMP